jgi:hypothetical protein
MNDSNTILRPPWLNLARALWILCAVVTALLFVVGGIGFFGNAFLSCTTPDAVCGPWQVSAEDLVLAQQLGMPVAFMQFMYFFNGVFPKLAFYAMGVLIFWRRSDDWVALLLSAMLVGFALEGIVVSGVLALFQGILYFAITIIFLALPFIFPNGRWIPRWTLWFAVPIIFFGALGGLIPVVAPFLNQDVYAFALLFPFLLWFLLGGYAAVYRYRRVSNARERQQTKWVMAGVLGTFVIFIPFTIIAIFFPPSQPSAERLAVVFLFYIPIGFLSYVFIPVSIAISILRYRLWDIDILIRRTVTYAVVVALLGVVYFGSVVLLQRIFAGIIGTESEIITVLSTLAIAALFVPLRNRIQDAIDKRFNRKKYDAQKVLQKFAETVRDETDLEKLSDELVNVVNETMQPKSVLLWLKNEERSR